MTSDSNQKKRRVVIVGIPGVGKSTVVNKIVELMSQGNRKTSVVNYGTVMFDQASKLHGMKSRDDMRKLPVELQRELQVHAASHIADLQDQFVIIDTHLFISTPEGFWPGMPISVLQALKPTHLVMVVASVDEILSRRANDPTRVRDSVTKVSLESEMEAAKSLLFASSLVVGCPALIVYNEEGKVDDAANRIIGAVFNSS